MTHHPHHHFAAPPDAGAADNRDLIAPSDPLPPVPPQVEVVEEPAGGPPVAEPDPTYAGADTRDISGARPVLAFF
jgi:hypothetical protein